MHELDGRKLAVGISGGDVVVYLADSREDFIGAAVAFGERVRLGAVITVVLEVDVIAHVEGGRGSLRCAKSLGLALVGP